MRADFAWQARKWLGRVTVSSCAKREYVIAREYINLSEEGSPDNENDSKKSFQFTNVFMSMSSDWPELCFLDRNNSGTSANNSGYRSAMSFLGENITDVVPA